MSTLVLLLLAAAATVHATSVANKGQWQLQNNIGIVAMHMQLLHNDRVVIYDRTGFRLSNLTLPNGRCRHDPRQPAAKTDCTAHSVEYDVASNTFRALFVQTDVWCSSGSAVANGTLVQTGGYNDGDRGVRTFQPCRTCDWQETSGALTVRRWYATNHILPDGRQIIIGGRYQFNYEFYPKTTPFDNKTYFLHFLAETFDKSSENKSVENNLYPFVFLNVDGNLFIFANNRAILFNYTSNTVVRNYPSIPGGDPRCYPSTGSAVLLPLTNIERETLEAEVLVCGGAPKGSYELANTGTFLPALNTCARIRITDPNPVWLMETMPYGRVMSDMILLPNGDVLIINGASSGTAAFELAVNPVYEPFIYKTNGPPGNRFEVLKSTDIARMYHSTAVLLRDGRVLVGGSNTHNDYQFGKLVFYKTELRVETFSPPYLDPQFSGLRPLIVVPASQTNLTYGQRFLIRITVNDTFVLPGTVAVTMYRPPFNTHSFSMNQRQLVLATDEFRVCGNLTYEFEATAPRNNVLAPPGYYILFVVHQEIPSEGIWIQIQ